MTTAYTPILQLALPVTGELQGAWGDVLNQSITSMVEQAIAGLATINTWTTQSHTLTTANGTTDEARCAVLECSGAPGGAATVICPALSKVYIIKNSVTGGYAVTLKTASGTGISVPNGGTALLYCDGTNVVSGGGLGGDVVGPASATDNAVARFDLTTGKLIQNSVVTIADTTGNMAGVGTLSSGAITSSALTSGRVPYAGTAGLIQDSANLTFNGTTLTAAGLSDSGNLTFTGTGNRITGDFSNATLANRVAIQSSTANGATTVFAIPNGTGSTAGFFANTDSSLANGSEAVMQISSTDMRFSSSLRGTGAYLPMTFYTSGLEKMRLAASGSFSIGNTTDNGAGRNGFTGTTFAPNITLTDAATVAWDTSTGQVATFTFVSSNRTMGAPTNLVNGGFYALAVIQNGGSNTLTWNSAFKFAGGVTPTLSTAAGAKDYFTFRSDGVSLFQQGISQAVA